MSRWSLRALCLVPALLFLTAPAIAADDAANLEGAKTLVAEIAAARKAKDAAATEAAAKKAVALHNGLEDKGLRGKLQKELGAALKSRHVAGAHGAVIESLGGLDDPKGAYKQLKRHMPGPKTEQATDREKAVLKAVDKLAPDAALKDLYDLAEKAKDYEAGALAIAALGSFKTSKKRVAILETLIKLLQRFQPVGDSIGQATRDRWAALSQPLVSACNEITGQKIRDPGEWQDFWKANKKKPKDIFVTD
ncbi:MAG: hypothetical protein QNJ90_04310 [Planctomycetota bacterium]|nr:hypothetical protein [Planctomycetota bacterium]